MKPPSVKSVRCAIYTRTADSHKNGHRRSARLTASYPAPRDTVGLLVPYQICCDHRRNGFGSRRAFGLIQEAK